MLKTELSIARKFPAGVRRLKISAKKRGLTVFSESQQGMRKATGPVAGDRVHLVDAAIVGALALAKSPSCEQRARMVDRVDSRLSPSFEPGLQLRVVRIDAGWS